MLNQRKLRGFTLIEALVTVAILAILASLSIVLLRNIQGGVQEGKLRKDVSKLNSAVKVYVSNGGSLDGITEASGVLAKLKTVTATTDHKQMVGLKGSVLDHRIKAKVQTAAEAASNGLRARWDDTKLRFYITDSGAPGISKFYIDDAAAGAGAVAESRSTNLKYSKTSRWVWDYIDRPNGSGSGPTNVPGEGTPGSAPPLNDPLAEALDEPIIEVPGGSYPLVQYPKLIGISNPNLPATSEIMYSVVAGVWSLYTEPIELEPGDTLEAKAVTVDPDHWVNSPPTSATYTTAPLTPELDVNLITSVDYISLGGALMSGAYPSPTLADPGVVSLANAAEIPPSYQSSTYFKVYWTFDGSNPVASASRVEGDAFSNGFVDQEIAIELDDFGTADSLTVKVATESHDPEFFNHSSITEQTITIDAIPLRSPVISIDGETIEMTLLTDFGDMPDGARIFYTTDGTDPGIGPDNEPLGGTLYSGSFVMADDAELVARVYPPADYLPWFTVSDSAADSYDSPFIREVFIGGRFALPDGTFRNVAKLGDNGAVDFGFDPGLGASFGSTVGVIMPQAGGKILAGGDFDSMDTTHRYAVVRLNGDGSVDSSFDAALE